MELTKQELNNLCLCINAILNLDKEYSFKFASLLIKNKNKLKDSFAEINDQLEWFKKESKRLMEKYSSDKSQTGNRITYQGLDKSEEYQKQNTELLDKLDAFTKEKVTVSVISIPEKVLPESFPINLLNGISCLINELN